MTKKHKKNNIIKILLAIFIWSIFWFSGQGVFFINYLSLENIDSNMVFIYFTFWLLFVAIVGIIIWRLKINDFSFLRIKNKKILWLYLVPILFAVVILINGAPVDINRYYYVFAMTTTTFLAQDMLTFGFLQTYLEKHTKPSYAAMITTLVFFIAHLTFDLSIFTLIYASGIILFGYLRYKTKNIYLLNIIHMSFLLLPFNIL